MISSVRILFAFIGLAASIFPVSAQQINPHDVTIIRDSFGIPHIYGKTDADAAYGLAWAHAEDDFESIQHAMLAARAQLGRVQGTKGVLFDFAIQFLKIDSLVEARFEQDLSEPYRKVLAGYASGLNAYAAAHPQEVLLKKGFPLQPQDIIKGYVLSTSLMAGLGMALKATKEDRIEEFYYANETGSNALAVAPHKMADGKAYLLSNSHQPTEGRFSWYEAHIVSEEGWDIMGGLFPGGNTIFVGVNQHLAWTHTMNYHNFGDIYQLEINPKNKREYKIDGEWKRFREKKIRLVVKIGPIRIPVKKKARYSDYGPVMKFKHGYYAFRFPGFMDIRSGEQWFKMNKARNLEEFTDAMKIQGHPLFNTVYADDQGNILLHSGGRIPKRDPSLDWHQPISAASSDYIWSEVLSYDQLPHAENPECGYVYNANNTPLHCTGNACEWVGDFPGLQLFEYNRGDVFGAFFKNHLGKFTPEELESLKFSNHYASDGTYMAHFEALYQLDPEKYPDIAPAIAKAKRWNLRGEVDNEDAALMMIAHDFLRQKYDRPFGFLMIRQAKIPEADAVWALGEAQKVLLKHYGTLDVPLGKVQRLIRGEVSLPMDGLREVPRAADTQPLKKGVYRVKGGDGFIQVIRFGPEGPEVKSIHAYGASTHPDSPHYTDQMQMFVDHEFRKMTFDRTAIEKNAERIYHPGE